MNITWENAFKWVFYKLNSQNYVMLRTFLPQVSTRATDNIHAFFVWCKLFWNEFYCKSRTLVTLNVLRWGLPNDSCSPLLPWCPWVSKALSPQPLWWSSSVAAQKKTVGWSWVWWCVDRAAAEDQLAEENMIRLINKMSAAEKNIWIGCLIL